jgi:hypothetical protein
VARGPGAYLTRMTKLALLAYASGLGFLSQLCISGNCLPM